MLDGRDASPHLAFMAKRDDEQKGAGESREAKLAQALRANLRRRKAAGASPPAQNPDKPSTD
ncbi:MAG: hypothetical protein DI570_22265 [Phenylobacterium zucineum]|nr:MAG: hypothetical protein DI570_22265 [Phenylobacterium zucineum]